MIGLSERQVKSRILRGVNTGKLLEQQPLEAIWSLKKVRPAMRDHVKTKKLSVRDDCMQNAQVAVSAVRRYFWGDK